MRLNRSHWGIEAMHRDKDVCPGEDSDTNRLDNAPRNMFTLTSAARTLLKRIDASPTRVTEIIQNDRNRAIRTLAQGLKTTFL